MATPTATLTREQVEAATAIATKVALLPPDVQHSVEMLLTGFIMSEQLRAEQANIKKSH